jgi:endonuclease YncB( thermonuclease family)
VVGIAAGDTITVLDSTNGQHKVRLAGIDAPEKAQPFGSRSKANLSGLVYGKTVTVEYVKFDRYQRMVGKVLVDGRDACLGQIKAGLAWWYRKYAREQSTEDQRDYEAAEGEAQAAGRGLWADSNPVPPWEVATTGSMKGNGHSLGGSGGAPTIPSVSVFLSGNGVSVKVLIPVSLAP